MSFQFFLKSLVKWVACSSALVVWAQASEVAAPKPPAKVSPAKPSAAKPSPEGTWQTLATSSRSWSGGKDCSSYVDGKFDLSKAQWIRVTFEASQAGTKFFLRLLPEGGSPGQSVGVLWEALIIPADGVVVLPLKPKDFGLTPEKLSHLVQISVHSGEHAWGRPLGQEASKCAQFKKIEIQ